MKLMEISTIESAADEHVFRGCKLLGSKSRNGYTYDRKAVEQAREKYINAPVYVNHSDKSRSYQDRVGVIQNPTVIDGELYGDVVLNPRHPLAESILWDAKNNTTGVGFSHSIDGKLNKKSQVVESIDRVFSVDLVASPATVVSMFEQEQTEQLVTDNAIVELKTQNESLKTQLAELENKVKELSAVKPIAVAPMSQPARNTYGDWLEKIRGKR